jgi:uncharacterized protein YdaU (DUF1376 family)
MNYYEHHIGDYAEATGHLSLLEDAVYSRLLRKYYSTEQPLPADKKKLARWVGAVGNKDALAALDVVLDDFFTLQDDGYHNERCDSEIQAFHDGEPERELKKVNEKNRLNNHRQERARLFKVLTDAGGHAAWNIGIAELRVLVKSVTGGSNRPPAAQPATAPATPATATQTPLPNTQYPNTQGESVDHQQGGPGGPARAGFENGESGSDAQPGAEAAEAMVAAGLSDVSATHPKLLALLAAGMSVAELRAAAVYAHGKGAGFAYALSRAEGQRRDAAAMAALPDAPAAAGSDPDSVDAVQAEAERLGIGRWVAGNLDAKGVHESWPVFKARVRRAQAASEVSA